MHADLLEHPAVHHRHDAAAARAAGVIGALPGRALEAAGRAIGQRAPAGSASSTVSKRRADVVAQLLEPGAGAVLAGVERRSVGEGAGHRVRF